MGTIMKTDSDNYNDIADAIREKSSSSDTYLPSEMGDAIRAIPQEGGGVSMEVIAPEYDNTRTYRTLDLAVYNNKLYSCYEDIDIPEDFDEDKWDEISLGQMCNYLNHDLGYITDFFENLIGTPEYSSSTTYNKGDYIILPETSKLYKCVVDILYPEQFNPNKWAETTVIEELSLLEGLLIEPFNQSKFYHKDDFCTYNNQLYVALEAHNPNASWDVNKWQAINFTEGINNYRLKTYLPTARAGLHVYPEEQEETHSQYTFLNVGHYCRNSDSKSFRIALYAGETSSEIRM